MRKLHVSLAAAVLLAVTGCGGGGGGGSKESEPSVTVPDLAAGAHIVSVGSADDLTIGKYYADGNGGRLLVLNDDNERANALYRRQNSSSKWVAVPKPTADVTVSFVQSNTIAADSVTVADVVGSYATRLSNGDAADFAIGTDGTVTAGSSACKLSGKVEAGTLPSTLKLTLNAASCSGVPASSSGVLLVDRDYTPAAFRLVSDNGTQVVDLWAFAD